MANITLPAFDPKSQLIEKISLLRHDKRNTIARRFMLTMMELRLCKYGRITPRQMKALYRIAQERGVKL